MNLNTPFGIKNYYNMYKAKGLKYALGYFKEAHLWDLLHGTDTHKQILPSDFGNELADSEDCSFYGTSWNSEIIHTFHMIANLINNDFGDYDFLDIGSGKGKILMVWQQLLNKNELSQRVTGIEYSQTLSDISIKNYLKVFKTEPNIKTIDITTFEYNKYNDKFIIYFYNPFVGELLNKFISGLHDCKVILIYSNPQEKEKFLHNNFKEFSSFTIYKRETIILTNFDI